MMQKYPKIQTLFKRCTEKGPDKNKLIEGDWTLPEFEALADLEWEATEKIDGTNISVIWDGEKVQFAGRDEDAQIPARLVNHLIGIFTADLFHSLELPPMIVFGEGYGAGIQKVGKLYKENGAGFTPFDIWCGDLWLERKNVVSIAVKLGVNPVPALGMMPLGRAIDVVRGGFNSFIGGQDAPAEGLVLRAPCDLLTRRGERLMAKIKTKDFQRGLVDRPVPGGE